MTLQSMSFIFGALLLAVGILGGGLEVKEIKVSNVSIGVRIVAGIIGLFFIGLGFWQQLSAVTESESAPAGSSAPKSSSAPASSGTGPAQSAPGPPPKPAEALVAEELPFISDRERFNVGALYVPAQDHKALAISHSRIGMITGQADVETAKNGALDNCRTALERARINNKCELYAVGNTVVFQGGHPPMPPRPWLRSDPSIERPVNSKDVPFVNARDRSWIEKDYHAAHKSKALAISPRGGIHFTVGALSQDESARRTLEICGHMAGVACMIIAIDDVFVVPIPTMMSAVGFFQPAGNALIAPGSRDNVARRLATGTRGWSAVATGANGLAGVVPDTGSEQSAIEGALADCSRRDHGCHVIAIGPFSVAEISKTP
jgi:hypothetical protein